MRKRHPSQSQKADSSATSSARMQTWLAYPLDAPVKRALELARRADDVARLAVMPDVHLAGDLCVGTVLATRRLIYPGAVGGDIGCGMLALAFDASADVLDNAARAGEVLRQLNERVPGTRHRRREAAALPGTLNPSELSHTTIAVAAHRDAALQLGTLGGGNHFVELQADADERLWLMIHSGSRGMGQTIRNCHVEFAQGRSNGMPWLDAATDAGRAYLQDQQWARHYASANRHAMADAVAAVLRETAGIEPDLSTLIECDHNHVQLEEHFGESLLIHRKGAMPAGAGVAGMVPGSMGSFSVHVTGLGLPESLQSSAHGAGRRLTRAEARRQITQAVLAKHMQGIWHDTGHRGLCEEAPGAYRDLSAVLRAQRKLVKVHRRLRPKLVYKGR